jgi:deoxyhypusine synthase
MHLAENALRDFGTRLIPSIDVNETAAIVFGVKKAKHKSAILLIGGGSPKNFILQTEPLILAVCPALRRMKLYPGVRSTRSDCLMQ